MSVAARTALQGSDRVLADAYDVALLDLDGVVYVGERAVTHAAPALAQARSRGMRLAFVTNNASRTPETVASHLGSLGIPARSGEVVTSAQAAARVVAELVPPGAAVLVVGGAGLVAALQEHRLSPVFSAQENPQAIVQGYDPDLSWRSLAEGAFALHQGVPWVASNVDPTLPTSRGLAPGNGAFVEVLRATTGRTPVVAGKPEPPMHREAMIRTRARHPLVVGDRLDTDIEGANRMGVDSLLVLTGVTDPVEVVLAGSSLRPTYVAADLRGLLSGHPPVSVGPDGWARCRSWAARLDAEGIQLRRVDDQAGGAGRAECDDGVDALRALAAAVWSSPAQLRPGRSQIEAALAAVEGRETSVASQESRT